MDFRKSDICAIPFPVLCVYLSEFPIWKELVNSRLLMAVLSLEGRNKSEGD